MGSLNAGEALQRQQPSANETMGTTWNVRWRTRVRRLGWALLIGFTIKGLVTSTLIVLALVLISD